MGYRYIYFGMGTKLAKRIDSYLTSERKMMIERVMSEKKQKTIRSLLETVGENRMQKWKQGKGNVGNPPLSRISNNPDTNSVSVDS